MSLLVRTGNLVFVLKCIAGDSANLIYRVVCGLCAYLNYLLFRQGMAPYADYLMAVMFGDYLFMMILGVTTIVFFTKSFSEPDNDINDIILVISALLFYNSFCVVFGGTFYLVQD